MISLLRKNGRKVPRGLFLLPALFLLAACAPPFAELERPPTDATVTAASLLPPGQASVASLPGSLDGAAVTTDSGGRMEAYRFPTAGLAEEAFAARETRIGARHDVTSRSSVHVGANVFGRYSGAEVAGVYWVSATWLFVAEAHNEPDLVALLRDSTAGGVSEKVSHRGPLRWLLLAFFGLIGSIVLLVWLFRAAARGRTNGPPPPPRN